jgi:hypothetical protein
MGNNSQLRLWERSIALPKLPELIGPHVCRKGEVFVRWKQDATLGPRLSLEAKPDSIFHRRGLSTRQSGSFISFSR